MGNDPQAPLAPKKKKWGAGMIVLVVFSCMVVVGLIAGGIGAYFVLSSEKGRAVVGLVGDGYKLMQGARTAPGTDALRKLGCSEAMVMNAGEFARLASRFDAGHGEAPPDLDDIVVCTTGMFSKTIGCDDVAHTYVSTVGVRERSFFVSVQKSGEGKPRCSVRYDRSGRALEGNPESADTEDGQ